jgi:hypothetical protein
MSQYLVTCVCGRQLPVEVGQAGEQLTCVCGTNVAVPTLRQLRQLPVATAAEPSPVARHSWGARQGTIAASLILATLLLLGAAASRYSEHPLPQFHPEAQTKMVDQFLTKKSPAELWQIWTENYRQLGHTGFTAMEDPRTAPIQQDIDQHRRIQLVLVSLAGAFIAMATVLWLGGRMAPSQKKSNA